MSAPWATATDDDGISALARACRLLHVSGRGGRYCFYVVIHLCAVPHTQQSADGQ